MSGVPAEDHDPNDCEFCDPGCRHDWRFDGDDPYLVCFKCGERVDVLTGAVITAGRT